MNNDLDYSHYHRHPYDYRYKKEDKPFFFLNCKYDNFYESFNIDSDEYYEFFKKR